MVQERTPLSILILAIISLTIVGCSHRIYVPTEIIHSTDTVVRERVVHDSVRFEIPVEVERIVTRDTVSVLENDYATSTAMVTDGFLHHSLETLPHVVYVPVTYTVHDTVTVVRDSESRTIVQEVEKKLTWWQETRLRLFWVFLFIFLVYGAFRALKWYLARR